MKAMLFAIDIITIFKRINNIKLLTYGTPDHTGRGPNTDQQVPGNEEHHHG